MHIALNYGKKELVVELPAELAVEVIVKKPMPVLPEPVAAVRDALANPVGSALLRQEVKGCRSACILICDITRPVPNAVILPTLIRELQEAGMELPAITVLVATGLHRPCEGEELRELVGNDWVLENVRVVNHFARNDQDHVTVGQTRRGTSVRLDRRFVEADLKIATGLVEPHFMAGYSGGRKVVAPGIAHQDTITTFHNARFLDHPKADNCVLEGNPLHEELLEIVRMLPRVLAVNCVIDEKRNLSFVNYGEIEASHRQAVAVMRRYGEIEVDRRFRTVITTGGGYPLDKTYYQTVKGMVGAMGLLEPGGDIVIFSECSEGMGSVEYVQAQRRLASLGEEGFRQSLLSKRHAEIDEWQTEMQLKPMVLGKVHLYSSGLSRADRVLTGVHFAEDDQVPAEFIRKIIEQSGATRVAVIPEGPYVIPRCR